MLILLILAGLVSAAFCALLLRAGRANASRYGEAKPQRFHAGDVPRLGGAAMLFACSAGWGAMVLTSPEGAGWPARTAAAWWLAMLLAAGAGLAEDITHRLAARWRLLLTLAAGVLATLALDLSIGPLGLDALAPLWAAAPWVGAALAVVAVAGLPHAFNLIDGYNGLAGLVALMCSLVLASVAWQVGDGPIAGAMLVTAGATAGFLLWNYPRGLIFAGDGGAYLWGTAIALGSVQLVQNHPEVSPWFPALLLIYPVCETLFSIYRKLARGQSPGQADALHFHQLVHRRIVRGPRHPDQQRRMLIRNNRTAPYLWGLALMAAIPAALFWRHTGVLMALCALFIASYVAAYIGIVRFKVPRWLRR